MLKSVDLPQPDGPIRSHEFARTNGEVYIADRDDLTADAAKAFPDIDELQMVRLRHRRRAAAMCGRRLLHGGVGLDQSFLSAFGTFSQNEESKAALRSTGFFNAPYFSKLS